MKVYFSISCFLVVLVFTSCSKPPEGTYIGNFYGIDTDSNEHHELDKTLMITDHDRHNLYFGNLGQLEKNGKSIEGTVYLNGSYSIQPYLIGTWEKKNGHYYLTGEYAAVISTSEIIKGPFEIISKR